MQALLIKVLFLYLLLTLISIDGNKAYTQEPASDTSMLMARFDRSTPLQGKDVSFMQSSNDRLLVRYNPVNLTFGAMMFVYQRFMSPQLPSTCLYHPSCSAFSKSLIREYGLVVGVVTTADRLFRCNRVAAFDIHPMHFDTGSGKVVEEPSIYRINPK